METGWSDPAANLDLLLVEGSKGGDLSAFEKLVDRHQGRLFHLSLGITRKRLDAEDVVQKSFLQAFVQLDTFQGDSRFSTWLMKIAINEALMNLRKKR